MRYTTHCRIAVLALVALVSACKSDSSVGPSNPPPATLNQVFSEMSLPALSGAVRGAAPTTGTMSLMPPVPNGCSYDASTHGFVCPTFPTATGVSVTQSYMLYDKAGNSQSQYDPASTDAVRIITTMAGKETSGTFSSTINSTQDITLSGLQSGLHVLNGTTNLHLTTQDTGLPTAGPIDDTVVATFANIVMPSGTDKWPQSGTLTIDGTSKVTGLAGPVSVHMVMTFNGTSKVPLTIGDGTHSSPCTIDLAGLGIPSCTFPFP
jgi:hypothetical protein